MEQLARTALLLGSLAALALSLSHLIYQYLRLTDAYASLLWP